MKQLFTCPRRVEDGMASDDSPFKHAGSNKDYWYEREGYLVCNYCGSLKPETLFEFIDKNVLITPTDKSYKIYVDLPGDGKRVVMGTANHPVEGWKKRLFKKEWVLYGNRDKVHGKFYFQHLSEDQKRQFIQLMNEKKLNLAFPGHFYRLPFFVQREANEN